MAQPGSFGPGCAPGDVVELAPESFQVMTDYAVDRLALTT